MSCAKAHKAFLISVSKSEIWSLKNKKKHSTDMWKSVCVRLVQHVCVLCQTQAVMVSSSGLAVSWDWKLLIIPLQFLWNRWGSEKARVKQSYSLMCLYRNEAALHSRSKRGFLRVSECGTTPCQRLPCVWHILCRFESSGGKEVRGGLSVVV